MGAQWHKRAIIISAGLFLIPCLSMLSLSSQAGQAASLTQGSPTAPATVITATSIPTPTPTLLPLSSTPTPTLEAVSYPQMLAVYKEVLETTKWILTVILTLFAASGFGGLWFGLKGIREVHEKASELSIKLDEAKRLNAELTARLRKQSKETESLHASLARLKEELDDIEEQAALAGRDVKRIVPRLETLANIDTYAMRLFSTNNKISRVAKRTLIELSKDEDPVVRRKCVRVFGAMPDYPDCFIDLQDPLIISRLREMVLKDPERGVQLEARHTLRNFGVDLRDEQAERNT
jgi:cell division protein FtsB